MLSNLLNNPSPQNNPNEDDAHDAPVINSFDVSEMPQPELAGHAWRQRGIEIICGSCPFTHSSTPTDTITGMPALLTHQLTGIDPKTGYPIFTKLVVH